MPTEPADRPDDPADTGNRAPVSSGRDLVAPTAPVAPAAPITPFAQSRRSAPFAPFAPSAAELGLPDAVPCPFCGGTQTELHSAFGSRLSVASYWCRPCRTVFEWLRPPAISAD